MIGFVNGLFAPPVMALYPAYEDFFFTAAGAHTFTIPKGAKTMDVTCIGGGAGGQTGGVSYGNIQNAWPAGGGSGGTGEIRHSMSVSVTPGESYSLTVGAGGNAYGGAGGASRFGSLVTAAGGQPGELGQNEPLNNQSTANGGRGGIGGIGGNGGGPGRGQYATLLGASGENGQSTQTWSSWPKAEWYALRDERTGRRLGQSARGGYGYDLGSNGGQTARGLSAQEAPGTMYGSGGQGGDQKKTGTYQEPGAGGTGLVAVRIHYK